MESDDFLDSTLEVTVTTDRESLMKRARPTGKAMLIVLGGARVGQRVLLGEEDFIIGRGTAAGLQLEGDAISRTHARIQWLEGEHFLLDCGSTNGSFVNYTKVREKRLSDGDEVQIGHVLLKYLSGDNIETAYHEEFRRLVRQDGLTGALNRPTFDEELRVALRQRERRNGSLCLLLFDLDHFKDLNDTHGHTAGDLVLRDVGAAVSALVGKEHQFARTGGEEFAVIFSGTMEAAQLFAERLRRTVEELVVRYEEKTLPITTSVGIAAARAGQVSADLYEVADKLLYKAKEGGRNQVCA